MIVRVPARQSTRAGRWAVDPLRTRYTDRLVTVDGRTASDIRAVTATSRRTPVARVLGDVRTTDGETVSGDPVAVGAGVGVAVGLCVTGAVVMSSDQPPRTPV